MPTTPAKRTGRTKVAVALVAAVLALAFAGYRLAQTPEAPEGPEGPVSTRHRRPSPGEPKDGTGVSPELLIAKVDAGHPVDPHGPEVARAKQALDAAQSRFDNSREEIAGKAIVTHDFMTGAKRASSVVDLLERAAAEVKPGGPKSKRLGPILERLSDTGAPVGTPASLPAGAGAD